MRFTVLNQPDREAGLLCFCVLCEIINPNHVGVYEGIDRFIIE